MIHTIWKEDINIEDFRDDLEEAFPDRSWNELKNSPEAYTYCAELNGEYLNDERWNLDIQLPYPILMVANLGLWNGRRWTYHVFESGKISDCLYSLLTCDSMCHWYLDDNGDLCCDEAHHDGTNHYIYRMIKPTASGNLEDRIELIAEKILSKDFEIKSIKRYTNRLGDKIADVYGWSIKGGVRL